MNTFGAFNSAAATATTIPLNTNAARSPITLKKHGNLDASDAISLQPKGATKEEIHEQFTQFVGQAFYGQMFKAMRSSVGKPAYFHGGRGEEVFQSQLDQTMADQMTKRTAATFADPMFERQFPKLADPKPVADFSQLTQLSRR